MGFDATLQINGNNLERREGFMLFIKPVVKGIMLLLMGVKEEILHVIM
jgi:hypothetical protein